MNEQTSLENKVETAHKLYLISTASAVVTISVVYLYMAYNSLWNDARLFTVGLAGGAIVTNLINGLTNLQNKLHR